MKINKIILNTIFTSYLCSNSIAVLAGEIPFKIAVIENAIGSKDIAAGKINKFIQTLPVEHTKESNFESDMSLCAAYIKSQTIEKSELACTDAIKSLEAKNLSGTKAIYLKALSYSNRGVSRYLNNDISGSMGDFTTAILLDVNPITTSNLTLIKDVFLSSRMKEDYEISVALAE